MRPGIPVGAISTLPSRAMRSSSPGWTAAWTAGRSAVTVNTTRPCSASIVATRSRPFGMAVMTFFSWSSLAMSAAGCGATREMAFPTSSRKPLGTRSAAPTTTAKTLTARMTTTEPPTNCQGQKGTNAARFIARRPGKGHTSVRDTGPLSGRARFAAHSSTKTEIPGRAIHEVCGFVAACALLLSFPTQAIARSDAAGAHAPVFPGPAGPGSARCHAQLVWDGATPLATSSPTGLSPATIKSAYGYSTSATAGAGMSIGIVDAYDDPTAESDLAVFSSTFGLPACTTANGAFRKVDQNGGTKN